MFGSLCRWLYDLITRSGILLHVVPYLMPILKFLLVPKDPGNHKETDDEGFVINLTKINGRVYPPFDPSALGRVHDFTIREDDVMLCGFPKTGCHWVYEIMYMLVHQKAALSTHGKEVGGMIDLIPPIIIDSNPSPRVLNSHHPYDHLPWQVKEKKTKIVVTVRHPKDTVVSEYNHVKVIPDLYKYEGNFNSYFKMWMAGKLQHGSYFDHILSWEDAMKNQTDNPIFVVEYEKLQKDPVTVVKELARFLDVPIADKLAEDIVQESCFQKMKEKRRKDPTGKLYRKGQVGDWRNWLTDDQSAEIDRVWKERMTGCSYQPDL